MKSQVFYHAIEYNTIGSRGQTQLYLSSIHVQDKYQKSTRGISTLKKGKGKKRTLVAS